MRITLWIILRAFLRILHLALGVLVLAGVIPAAAAKAHDPHTVVLHNGIIDAVAALGGMLVIVGIVIARDIQHRAAGHGHEKLKIAGLQIAAGNDEIIFRQLSRGVVFPQCRTLFIGDE